MCGLSDGSVPPALAWSAGGPLASPSKKRRCKIGAAPVGARKRAAATTGAACRVVPSPPTDSHRRRSSWQARGADGSLFLRRDKNFRPCRIPDGTKLRFPAARAAGRALINQHLTSEMPARTFRNFRKVPKGDIRGLRRRDPLRCFTRKAYAIAGRNTAGPSHYRTCWRPRAEPGCDMVPSSHPMGAWDDGR